MGGTRTHDFQSYGPIVMSHVHFSTTTFYTRTKKMKRVFLVIFKRIRIVNPFVCGRGSLVQLTHFDGNRCVLFVSFWLINNNYIF